MSAFKNVPDPTFDVIPESKYWKAELSLHVPKKDRMGTRETRIRGPKRDTRREAQLDGHELKRAGVLAGTHAEAAVRKKQGDLLRREWTAKDLEDFEAVATQLDSLIAERKRLDKLSRCGSDRCYQTYQPVDAGTWSLCGPLMPRPNWGGPWSVYQRHNPATGKFTPYLYFNTSTNDYYYDGASNYAKAGPPALPQTVPLSMRHAFHTEPLDFSLVLSDLHRTGILVKQRLDFLDLPASCMCLFDDLQVKSDVGDISFLPKTFHKHLFAKLTARHTEWEDFELRDLLIEALELLDAQWLDTPNGMNGAGAAVALIVGSRLTAASLAGSVVVSLNLNQGTPQLHTQASTCTDLSDKDRNRIQSYGGYIGNDISMERREGTPADRINHARNSFEVLGIRSSAEFSTIVKLYRRLTLQVHPDKCKDEGATEAFGKLEKAKEALVGAYELDPKVLGELLDLFTLYHNSPVLRMPVLKELEVKARNHARIVRSCQDDVLKAQQILVEVQSLMKTQLLEESRTTHAPFATALGLRSMKKPFPYVTTRPDACMPVDLAPGKHAIALFSSAARINAGNVQEVGEYLRTHVDKPRACAMALSRAYNCSAVVTFATVDETASASQPPQKKAKHEQVDRVFLRHILIKFLGCRPDLSDRYPEADAAWRTRTLREAEDLMVDSMAAATKTLSDFSSKCREVSDCKSGTNPMSMCGQIGWISRGHMSEKLETAAFDLALDAVSDVIQTERGLQILRRVG